MRSNLRITAHLNQDIMNDSMLVGTLTQGGSRANGNTVVYTRYRSFGSCGARLTC